MQEQSPAPAPVAPAPGPAALPADDLACVADGDLTALLRIYDEYASLAYAVALRIAGDPERAQRAVELTFLSIRRQARLYHEGLGPLHRWIAQVAYGQALALLRSG